MLFSCLAPAARSLQLYLTLCNPVDGAYQAPLSMEFSRQEYCSGLPFPSPGDLPDPGIEPMSPGASALQADSLSLSHQGSLNYSIRVWSLMGFFF